MGKSLQQMALPDSFSILKRSIERWRAKRRPREKMPEDLWREAAELASEHGTNRIARALRLDYYSLKKRVAAADRSRESAPEFFEILPGGIPAPRPECTIEVEDGSGAKLRISLCGTEIPDIPTLARAFREAGK